ncbi:MAG: GNAT family N-acetyltransferase [Alphaproteobacteria bacterium]|nr:GNAT family N-acetyltransferase [Alphaproteobacteria bacterium]
MIRDYEEENFVAVLDVINDAATAYKGIIPEDCWHDPYMSATELQREINTGVSFRMVLNEENIVMGVMGAQPVQDVLLIRHAYVRTQARRRGIGSQLISDLRKRTALPILVGTWAAAAWAIQFYEDHGFMAQSDKLTQELLKKYWSVPEAQADQSVVLMDQS